MLLLLKKISPSRRPSPPQNYKLTYKPKAYVQREDTSLRRVLLTRSLMTALAPGLALPPITAWGSSLDLSKLALWIAPGSGSNSDSHHGSSPLNRDRRGHRICAAEEVSAGPFNSPD